MGYTILAHDRVNYHNFGKSEKCQVSFLDFAKDMMQK